MQNYDVISQVTSSDKTYAHDFSFRHLQASTDTKTSELRNEVKLKAFEAERLQIVYEESVRTLKECQLENEKLQKKLQVRAGSTGLTAVV